MNEPSTTSNQLEMYIFNSLSFILILLTLVDVQATTTQETRLKNIASKAEALKQEVKLALRTFRENCNSSIGYDDDYSKIVQEFLHENITNIRQHVPTQPYEPSTAPSVIDSTKSFMTKLRKKISSLVHRNKTQVNSENRIKRCLKSNLVVSDISEAEVTIERETFNMTSEKALEFVNFLTNFLQCLKMEASEESIKTTASPDPGLLKKKHFAISYQNLILF